MSGKFEKINCTKTNWGILDFTLMKNIGNPIASILLTEYISFYNSVRNKNDFDGELYRSRKTITDKMGLSLQEQRTAEGRLKELDLIEITVKGIPATNHIRLNWDNITEYQKQDFINQQTCPTENDSSCNNNDLQDEDNVHKNSCKKSKVVLEPTNSSVADNNLYSIRKKEESFNKLKETDLEKPNQTKSRLNKKEIPIFVKKKERPSLLKEPKKVNAPLKKLSLSERNKICIDYWNSKPELQSHSVNIDNPSKTIKLCINFLNSFFSGKLLDHSILPDNFDTSLWDNKTNTIEDFKYFVDEICYCYSEPSVLPKKNGHKMSMIDFLHGNDRLNISSGLLTYCVGEYKTVIENKHPKTVESIKKLWKENIGKFEPIPGNEKAFIVISNLCHEVYKERKEKDKDWLPSMNEYSPVSILRNVLAGNMWIKEKRHTPEYMDTKFFKGMVSRYDYDRTTGVKTW